MDGHLAWGGCTVVQQCALGWVVLRHERSFIEVQTLIAVPRQVELWQRMIQPVGGRNPELHALALGDFEVLVQSEVAVVL